MPACIQDTAQVIGDADAQLALRLLLRWRPDSGTAKLLQVIKWAETAMSTDGLSSLGCATQVDLRSTQMTCFTTIFVPSVYKYRVAWLCRDIHIKQQ